MTTASHVLFEVADGVATLTLNDAARMNPLSKELLQGCLDALDRVRADPAIHALLITGAGKAFCVGANLADLEPSGLSDSGQKAGTVIGELLAGSGNPLVLGLRSLQVPVVCAVNGAAAGGGVGLALAADVVVAARSAFFYLPFAPALGLVPDIGASWLLPRAVGRARAMGLSLLGHRLSAQEAAQWGLIWACVDDADLHAQSQSIAQRLANLPAHAIDEVRELNRMSEINSFEQQLVLELERQMELANLPTFEEGVRAFLEKRKPRFR